MGGVSHIWYENEDGQFRTDYGLTYTDQEDVVEDPTANNTFAGLRLGWDYLHPFGAISVNDAAIVPIHEALHHAGVTEQPDDPLGMTPNQIDQLVKTSCWL